MLKRYMIDAKGSGKRCRVKLWLNFENSLDNTQETGVIIRKSGVPPLILIMPNRVMHDVKHIKKS